MPHCFNRGKKQNPSHAPAPGQCRARIAGRMTDRLDTELLKRAFLGWLRGGRIIAAWRRSRQSKRRMPSGPTVSARVLLASARALSADEKHPGSFRHSRLQTDPTPGAGRLVGLLTAEGTPPPPNTLAEEVARRRRWRGWALSSARSGRSRLRAWNGSSGTLNKAPMRWSGCWRGSSALVSRPRTCWCTMILSRNLRDRQSGGALCRGNRRRPDETRRAATCEQGLARAWATPACAVADQVAWRFLMFQKDSVPGPIAGPGERACEEFLHLGGCVMLVAAQGRGDVGWRAGCWRRTSRNCRGTWWIWRLCCRRGIRHGWCGSLSRR